MKLSLLNECTSFNIEPVDGSLHAHFEYTADQLAFKDILFRANGIFNLFTPIINIENEGQRHSKDLHFDMNAFSLPFNPSPYWGLVNTHKHPRTGNEIFQCTSVEQIAGRFEQLDLADAFDAYKDVIIEYLEDVMTDPVINTDPSIVILPDDDNLLAAAISDEDLALHLNDSDRNKITFII